MKDPYSISFKIKNEEKSNDNFKYIYLQNSKKENGCLN